MAEVWTDSDGVLNIGGVKEVTCTQEMSLLYDVRDMVAKLRDASRTHSAGRHYSIAITEIESAILRLIAAQWPMVDAPRPEEDIDGE